MRLVTIIFFGRTNNYFLLVYVFLYACGLNLCLVFFFFSHVQRSVVIDEILGKLSFENILMARWEIEVVDFKKL